MYPILTEDYQDPLHLIAPDIYAPQQYAQGWNNITLELQKILQAVPMLGPVHRFIAWIKEAPGNRNWDKMFSYKRPGDDAQRVCAWLINAATSPVNENSEDDSVWFVRRTTAEIHGFFQIENPISFFLWNMMLVQVTNALRESDRTLNGTCLTYSLPDRADSGVGTFCGVDVHTIILRFEIEESGKLAVPEGV